MNADRFDDLYERFADGVLDGGERAEFLGLLELPEVRTRFARAASLEAAVCEEIRLAGIPAGTEEPVTTAESKKASSKTWPRVGSRRAQVQRTAPDEETLVVRALAGSAAAVILALALVWALSRPAGDAPRPLVAYPRPAPAGSIREVPPLAPPAAEPGPRVESHAPAALPPDERPAPRESVVRPSAAPAAPTVSPRPSPTPGEPPGPPATPPSPAPARPADPSRESTLFVATLERAAGDVRIGSEPGEAGKGIPPGLGVSTGRDGAATLRFPDGTRVELGSETNLGRLVESPAGRSAELAQGLLFVDAVRQPAGRTLVFLTPQAEASVVGTQFILAALPGLTRLDVREGRVKLTRLPQGVSSVMVTAGHYVLAGPTGEWVSRPGLSLWKPPAGGLQLWLRADQAARNAGPGVAAWPDLSGTGNTPLQDKPSARPLYVASAQAGRPAVRFDGVESSLVLPDGLADFRAGLSAFVVARPAPGGAGARFLDLDIGPACDNIVFGRKDSPDKLAFWVFANSLSKGKVEAPGAVIPDQLQTLSVVLTPFGHATIYHNGAPVGAGETSIPRSIPRKPNTLGRNTSGSGDSYFKGDLFELLLYNRALSEAERLHVEGYFAAKYLDPTTPPAGFPADK